MPATAPAVINGSAANVASRSARKGIPNVWDVINGLLILLEPGEDKVRISFAVWIIMEYTNIAIQSYKDMDNRETRQGKDNARLKWDCQL